jgi:hypothetical protein
VDADHDRVAAELVDVRLRRRLPLDPVDGRRRGDAVFERVAHVRLVRDADVFDDAPLPGRTGG